MGSKLRKEDENCANIIAKYLDEKLYQKYMTNITRIDDKEQQVKGIDIIFNYNDKTYVCDEKAAVRYINKELNTFAFELSFINKKGNVNERMANRRKKN